MERRKDLLSSVLEVVLYQELQGSNDYISDYF